MSALAPLLFDSRFAIVRRSRGEAREFKFDPRLGHVTRRERREESSRRSALATRLHAGYRPSIMNYRAQEAQGVRGAISTHLPCRARGDCGIPLVDWRLGRLAAALSRRFLPRRSSSNGRCPPAPGRTILANYRRVVDANEASPRENTRDRGERDTRARRNAFALAYLIR